MKKFFSGLILWVVFLGTFGTSVFFQNKGVNQVLKNAPFYDTWQLGGRSGEIMKLLSLRYDMVMADFLWLRSIQSFGGRGMSNRDWRPIYNQFQTLTDLDPLFADAYSFGNLVIGDEGGHLRPSLDLLDKGTFHVFRQYRLPFEAMYVAHWMMKDEATARWYGVMATRRKDAPEWVERMVAYLDVNSGEYYIGLDRFVGNLMQAIDAEEPAYQDIALKKASETINKWNALRLKEAADSFTTATGRAPANINELANQPALQNYETASMSRMIASAVALTEALGKKQIPEDILKNYAPLDPTVLQKKIALKSDDTKATDYQDVVFQDALTTVSGLPPSPDGKPYAINMIRYGNPTHAAEEVFVSQDKLDMDNREYLSTLRNQIMQRKQELGRWPSSLNEVFYTDFKTTEPYGGQWLYNPQTGLVQMSSHPEF